MSDKIENTQAWFTANFAEAVQWRRELHRHPQPPWLEFYATGYIAEKLDVWGYHIALGREIISAEKQLLLPDENTLQYEFDRAVQAGIKKEYIIPAQGGFTGVVATLTGTRPGPVIAFRFDIDSNEVVESDSLEHRPAKERFASEYYGYAHMCGHDAHAAIGLLLAKYFSEHRDEICGTVKFLFQPNEENMSGALAMAEMEVVDDVAYMLGGHVGLNLQEIGHIALHVHSFMALSRFEIVFKGRSSHAALRPNEGNNALLGACNAITNLYAISRHGEGASRINVGVIKAGTAWNVIAEQAYFQLETRGVTNRINEYVVERAMAVLEGTARMYGLEVEIKPAAAGLEGKNDQSLVELSTEVAQNMPYITKIWPSVGLDASEDFTVFMDRVQKRGGKALFVVFGTPTYGGHHNATFDIEEKVIQNGAQFFAAIYKELAK